LEAERERFFKIKPYTFATETNPQTGERIYRLTGIKDVPLEFSIILGDALHSLRSCLDHIAYHLAFVGSGRTKTSFPDARFPIYANAPEYASKVGRAVQGMGQDAIKAINAIQPYGGGNGEIFWHLASLNNIDKHRLLITALSNFQGHTALPSQREEIAIFHKGRISDFKNTFVAPNSKVFPLKAGDILLTITQAEVEDNMQFLFNISFAEPKIVEGNPVIETLHEMTNLIRHIIFDFDRLGLFC
jgi:hypothetical protein